MPSWQEEMAKQQAKVQSASQKRSSGSKLSGAKGGVIKANPPWANAGPNPAKVQAWTSQPAGPNPAKVQAWETAAGGPNPAKVQAEMSTRPNPFNVAPGGPGASGVAPGGGGRGQVAGGHIPQQLPFSQVNPYPATRPTSVFAGAQGGVTGSSSQNPYTTPTGNMPYPGAQTNFPPQQPRVGPIQGPPMPPKIGPIQGPPAPMSAPQSTAGAAPPGAGQYPISGAVIPVSQLPYGSINAIEQMQGTNQPYHTPPPPMPGQGGGAAGGAGGGGGGGAGMAELIGRRGPGEPWGGGDWSGGDGGGGGTVPGAPTPVVPPAGNDLPNLLNQVVQAKPGQAFKIPPALQRNLARLGLYDNFIAILQSLGISGLNNQGAYGFDTDFTLPATLANIDINALMAGLSAADQLALGMVLEDLVGVPVEPATPPAIPPTTPGTPGNTPSQPTT